MTPEDEERIRRIVQETSEETVRNSVPKVVRETFLLMGVALDSNSDVLNLQRDFSFVRGLRLRFWAGVSGCLAGLVTLGTVVAAFWHWITTPFGGSPPHTP